MATKKAKQVYNDYYAVVYPRGKFVGRLSKDFPELFTKSQLKGFVAGGRSKMRMVKVRVVFEEV